MRAILLALALSVLFAPPVYALSCAPPTLDGRAVVSAPAIFVGHAEKVLSETPKNSTLASAVFAVRVTKAWKGVKEGDVVPVRRNVSWGDYFETGRDYVIFIERREGDVLHVGLCGLTAPADDASETIAFLDKTFGK
jgi:hypothetical protein